MKGSGRDNHHLRSLLFRDKLDDGGDLVMAHVGASYALNSVFTATLSYDFQRWGLASGRTAIYNQFTQTNTLISGRASGGSQQSHMISLGLRADLGGVRKADGERADDAPPRSWNGLYAGATAGFQRGAMNWKALAFDFGPFGFPETAVRDRTANGVSFGLFGGYNLQFDRFVGGVEVDAASSAIEVMGQGLPGSATAPVLNAATDSITHRIDGDISARVRLGYLFTPRLLVYGAGGLAAANTTTFVSCPAGILSWCLLPQREREGGWKVGWTAAIGAEWAFARDWFVRAEYRHSNFGSDGHQYFAASLFDTVVAKTSLKVDRVNAGLGYRF